MAIQTDELNNLVTKVFTLRTLKDEVEEKLSEINKEIAKIEDAIVYHLKESNLTTFKGTAGTVTPYERVSYRVPKEPEKRKAFFDYLKSREIFENLITVNHATLNSFAKEHFEAAKARGDMFDQIPGLDAPEITVILSKTKGRTK